MELYIKLILVAQGVPTIIAKDTDFRLNKFNQIRTDDSLENGL